MTWWRQADPWFTYFTVVIWLRDVDWYVLVCCRYRAVRLVYTQIRSVGCLYSTASCSISAMLQHSTWNQSFSLCREKQDSLWSIKYKGGKMWNILLSSGVRFCISIFPQPFPLPVSSSSGKEKKCLAFLELVQVKQIMDLSLFIAFVMQKPKSAALLLLTQSVLSSAFSKQAEFLQCWQKKWCCKLLKMFCPLSITVNIVYVFP